jgi:hypothetical protein
MSAIRIGQSTAAMAGLMLLAAVELAHERWWRSAICLSLALAVKPLAIVMILLTAALYPAMRSRLTMGIAVVVAAPFLFQRPEYVWQQYLGCAEMLRLAVRRGDEQWWAQLFGLLKYLGWEVSSQGQTITRVFAAIATLALCWLAKHRRDAKTAAFFLYALSVCYLMLFNPRTENSTYCLLSPAIAVFIAEAFKERHAYWTGAALIIAVIGMVGSYEIGKFFTPETGRPVWLAPMMCAPFACYVAWRGCCDGLTRRVEREFHGLVRSA